MEGSNDGESVKVLKGEVRMELRLGEVLVLERDGEGRRREEREVFVQLRRFRLRQRFR